MGLFSGIANTAKRFGSGYGSGRSNLQASRAAIGEKAGSAIGFTAEKIGYALGRTGPMMALGIATATAAVAAVLGTWAYKSRQNRKTEQANEDRAQDLQAREIPAMDAGPASDRAPGEWQNRVAAARGQAPAVEQPLNPKQSVVPESSVQNLGR